MKGLAETVVALVAGVVFAVGLALSGMTQPGKVEAFLDIGGGWDPALGAVMGGAIGVHALAYLWKRRSGMAAPLLAGLSWDLPTRTSVDWRLFAGAVLFGVGWGVTGYCPGPAVMSLGTGSLDVVLFVGAMLVGMAGYARAEAWVASRRPASVDAVADTRAA